ncbi:MAG: HAD family hydrolase [Christensenellaceae bacterium]|jgi:putative hydrolase of the HAD superfamily|nr:HAD family hydrolase [Christensenellaceae bacterium]
MIRAVLFDVGGTFHTVHNDDALRVAFARRLKERLRVYDIAIEATSEELAAALYTNGEIYKHWSEDALCELPQPRIWNEFYLKDYHIGEDRLAPIAEELSFLYDYERVCNKRRPHLLKTIQELHQTGVRMGVVSNIISTSFVPHILNEYGIAQYMECVVMSSSAGFRKPNAEIFQLALRQMGLGAAETAYVGDTISRDVLGARNAGLGLMIQITNPAIAHRDAAYAKSGPAPDYRIDDFYEIAGIIRAHNAGK